MELIVLKSLMESLSKIKLKDFVLLLYLCSVIVNTNAQNITLNKNNVPLSEVLIELRDDYNIQISFNHKLASECLVSVNGNFTSPEEAVEQAIKQCKLDFETSNGVFIIYESENADSKIKELSPSFLFTGQLVDAYNAEPLPFSSIQGESYNLIADANGNFSFKTSKKLEQLKVSHVGYFMLDTVLPAGSNQKIYLTPSIVGLNEVLISTETKVYTAYIGEKPGLIKVNHKVASFLPGNNNNIMFNLLRLQPGIVATAEQSGDYIIWGSYKGQNLMLFDGITLFSANSLNNEIGVVNPLMVKDIEVYKGGYNVNIGDRVGGIVQMTGNNGNTNAVSANVNVNSETVSGAINVPILNKLAFQAAFRQTYYDVIDWNQYKVETIDTTKGFFKPTYDFRDLNFKLSGKSDKGAYFYISLIGNNDKSSFYIDDDAKFRGRAWENETQKQQLGASAHFGKNWNNGGISQLTAAFSSLETNAFDRENFRNVNGRNSRRERIVYRENVIEERSIKMDQIFASSGIHNLKAGLSLIENTTFYALDSVKISGNRNYSSNFRCGLYIKDKVILGSHLEVQPGLRLDYFPEQNRSFIQPRVNLLAKAGEHVKFNLAFGLYNQFITEMNLIDRLGNQYYFWGLSDNMHYKVLKSIHRVAGISYNHNNFKVGTEAYYKTIVDMSRFALTENRQLILTNGNARTYGLDFYVSKTIHKHDAWLSYTLSKTEEDFLPNKEYYVLAAHNQTHELKAAAILNFKPWYVSTNYVFGSGLHSSRGIQESEAKPYHRMDIALLYKFKTEKFNLETGLSIVNLFNYDNMGYTGFAYLPDKPAYAKGTPFTPSIFVNIGF